MNNAIAIRTVIYFVLILAPLIIWKHVNNAEIKFSIGLFIIHMIGFYLFTIIHAHLKKGEKQDGQNVWFDLLIIAFLLFMFYLYSSRIFEIVRSL